MIASGVAAGEPRADSPEHRPRVIVKKERPRLFVPEKSLPAIVRRARGPYRRFYLDSVRRACDENLTPERASRLASNGRQLHARLLALLTCWRIEARDEYRARALDLVHAAMEEDEGADRQLDHARVQAVAIAYDWLHATLSPEERGKIEAGLRRLLDRTEGGDDERELVSGFSHLNTASAVIGRLALWDGSSDAAAALEAALARWEKRLEVTRHVAADGCHHLGWRYGGSYAERVVWVSEALTTATNLNVFERERAWLSQLGYHCVYGLRPDDTYLRVGDTHREIDLTLDEDLVFFGILASRYRDPHLAWFANHTLDFCSSSRALASPSQHVFPLLFDDPDVPSKPPGDLPGVRAFRNAGNYIFRTGWKPEDTVVLFRAMPWYHLNHERRDFGSFTIYHRGGLAIHGGAYKTGDDASDYNGSHHSNYARRTIAHNTITVHDPDERFCNPFIMGPSRCKGENLWSNDGGQYIRTREDGVPSTQPRNVEEVRDPRFAQGSVPVFEDRADFAWVTADGTKAYRREKVELFERHLVYLKKVEGWKQPVVIVFDRVIAKQPCFRKTWNLHTVEAPKLEGNIATIENRTRIRFSGEEKARPSDHWHEYAGKLYSETLLPRDARIEFVGGEGKEFWVDGRNYGTQIREVDRIIEPGIGRIEVSPPRPSASDLFLHVLSPASCDDDAPRPRAALIDAAGGTALTLENHVVFFGDPGSKEAARTYAFESKRAVLHVVSGLRGDTLHGVTRNGSPLLEERSSRGGILAFRSPAGGKFRIVGRGPPAASGNGRSAAGR